MDHVQRCVKCGAALSHENPSSVPTYPPRAGQFKTLRRIRYWSQRKIGLVPPTLNVRERMISTQNGVKDALGALHQHRREFLAFFMSVVPGLGHVFVGQKGRGFVFFGVYAVSLFLGVFFYGRIASDIFFGIMMSCHMSAFFDCFPLLRDLTIRSRFAVMVLIIVVTLIGYRALYRAITDNLVSGIWMNQAFPNLDLRQDDFILVRPRDSYERGAVVFYAFSSIYTDGYDIRAGASCDRILGVPGDDVEIRDGNVYVNRNKVNEAKGPLNKNARLYDMEVTLDEDEYFIYDSSSRVTRLLAQSPASVLLQHAIVPSANIRGEPFLIYAPLRRLRAISD